MRTGSGQPRRDPFRNPRALEFRQRGEDMELHAAHGCRPDHLQPIEQGHQVAEGPPEPVQARADHDVDLSLCGVPEEAVEGQVVIRASRSARGSEPIIRS